MNAMTWFGSRNKDADRKVEQAVSHAAKAREAVTEAKERLERVLDLSDSRMERTLTRLVDAKRAPR